MATNYPARKRSRVQGLLIGRVVASILAVFLMVRPENLSAQSEEPIRTQFGRYIAPTFLGQLSGFIIGAGAARLLFYNKEKERLSDDEFLRTYGLIFMTGQAGGIIGAGTVAHDWKNVLLYNTIAHTSIVGGTFLLSPDLSNRMAVVVTVVYLYTAAIVTMTVASLVDSAYARKRVQAVVQPYLVPSEGGATIGVTFRLTWP